MISDWITPAMAAWGALLSTFALGWQFYRYFSNRPHLKVHCYIGYVSDDPQVQQLIWNVVNDKQAPVLVTSLGIVTNKLNPQADNVTISMFMVRTPTPKMLQSAEYLLHHVPLKDIATHFENDNESCIIGFNVLDSLGTKWTTPASCVKDVNRELFKLRGQTPNTKL